MIKKILAILIVSLLLNALLPGFVSGAGDEGIKIGQNPGGKEQVTEITTVAVHNETFLEEYGPWIFALALILFILIVAALLFPKKKQEPEKKQKTGGLRGVMKN